MAERIVKIAAFSYFEDQPLLQTSDGRITSDPDEGQPVFDEAGEPLTIKVRRLARLGDELGELSEEDEARAQDLGVFDDPPELPNVIAPQGSDDEQQAGGESPAPAEDPEGWLREARPSVKDVLEAAGTDKELAQRLLDAEAAVTGGKPRKGVVEGLTAVVDAQGDGESPAPAEDE